MCMGVIKRVLPFFLTFAAGLFVASFFVTMTAPNFAFGTRGNRFNRCREYQRMQSDYYDLKRENERLQLELKAARRDANDFDIDKLDVPPPFVPDNVPPPPPRVRSLR